MKATSRRSALGVAAAVALAAATLASQSSVHAASAATYGLATLAGYGGEPSITADSNGVLYDTSPSGPQTYRSVDKGVSWQAIESPDPNSGDDCLATDESNALYWCNLASTSNGVLPLQADAWKSTTATTCTTSCGWVVGQGAVPGSCSTSCNPFGVDRQWVASSIIPPATTTAQAEVVLMYHDFYGPSQIWVNISHDGGATFGAPHEVLASPSVTPGAVTGSLTAEGFTFCNTVPTETDIVKQGLPHAGRIYVSWIAADIPTDGSGCNITQAEAFHTLWVSYSDDNGVTWTAQEAMDVGAGHDTSSPFVAFTLDDQGNPYIAFTSPNPSAPPAASTAFATCSAESATDAQQGDPNCSFNTYVVWASSYSSSGVPQFDGGTGLIPGSAAAAYEVNPTTETGTDVFPAIAAHDPGQVDVAYLHTSEVVPTDAEGKFDPGGCAGNTATGNPPTYPPTCSWNLYQGQSANLTAAPGTATFTGGAITPTPMHVGDICNLGIACGPTSNRHLLDFIQAAMDPTTGCAHIAYADDNTVNKLRTADQLTGCFAPNALLPEAPWAALFIPAAAAAAFIGVGGRRRRTRRRPALTD